MKESNSCCEFLSQSGKMVIVVVLFGIFVLFVYVVVVGILNCEVNNIMKIIDLYYYFDNVLLEIGFDYENGVVVQICMVCQIVEIQDGKIVVLCENKLYLDVMLLYYDVGGKLMLYIICDMYIYFDKIFYGGLWCLFNCLVGIIIQDMIKFEQKMLLEL